jgi:probable HAF family extracellular repeat protein
MPTDDSGRLQFPGGSLSNSTPSLHWILGLSAVLWALGTISQAQTQASCAFTFFQTSFQTGLQLTPFGINDFGTVVGAANDPNKHFQTGFIRWANGGLTSFAAPNGPSLLFARNDKGVSLGLENTNAIILIGTNVSRITLTIGATTYTAVQGFGINSWGSIVGEYGDTAGVNHGFKRWSNGSGLTLDFPNAVDTFARAINDSGTIVGTIGVTPLTHGFIYHNGSWAKVDYPNADATTLVGISNAGVVIGNSSSANGTSKAFLYNNGVFKVISPPNTTGSYVTGMSLKSGLILGVAYSNVAFGGQQGFVAKCN